jgi:hypothetical protein
MDNTGLQRRPREHRLQRRRHAAQTIRHRDQDIIHAAGLQIVGN